MELNTKKIKVDKTPSTPSISNKKKQIEKKKEINRKISGSQFAAFYKLKDFIYFINKKYGQEEKTFGEWEKCLIKDGVINKF